jgi:hypothetical protein
LPCERHASGLFRRIFLDFDHLSALVRTWAGSSRIIEIGCGEGGIASMTGHNIHRMIATCFAKTPVHAKRPTGVGRHNLAFHVWVPGGVS